jgi:hypothetical protein
MVDTLLPDIAGTPILEYKEKMDRIDAQLRMITTLQHSG